MTTSQERNIRFQQEEQKEDRFLRRGYTVDPFAAWQTPSPHAFSDISPLSLADSARAFALRMKEEGITYALGTPTQTIEHRVERRLEEFETKLQRAIDIGLENRSLLSKVLDADDENRTGMGAIHTLDQGRVQLVQPLVYSWQSFEEDTVVSIEELGVYAAGDTCQEAVEELQGDLWSLYQDLNQTPPHLLGPSLVKTLRILRGRIKSDAVDA